MPRIKHSPAIVGAWTHNGVKYPINDGIIEVEDMETAREMCEHRRLTLLDDADPVCGVNGCSRTVDHADATCWQHE